MSDTNMRIYDKVRTTPKEAQTPIADGDLKNKTSVNPQYRIETLTKAFGPIGIGWFYKVVRQESLDSPATQEIMCFVDIELFVKEEGEWSQAIFGTGGSKLINNFTTRGMKSSDDGWKKATTDALSVACKQLGIGADIYWHEGENADKLQPAPKAAAPKPVSPPAQPAPKIAPAPPITQEPPTLNERIDGVCKWHKVSQSTFGNVLKELQAQNKVADKRVAEMTAEEVDLMIKEVSQAIINKKKENQK